MKSLASILFFSYLLSCAAAPDQVPFKKPPTERPSEMVGPGTGDVGTPGENPGNDPGMSDGSIGEVDGRSKQDEEKKAEDDERKKADELRKAEELRREEVDNKNPVYAFDGAFPLAASLMATNWKWDQSGQPLGWGEVNVFTAILEYTYVSGSSEYLYLIPKVYAASVNKGEKNFINEFYDDTGWWGLAWIRAYDITKDKKYLDAAKFIADYMHNTGWNNKTCGGGLYWKRGAGYKAAIANGLYIKILASLHNRISGDTKYLKHAKEAWDWYMNSGLVDGDNVAMDGVDENTCKAGGAKFTYNQGLLQGSAIELYKATKDEKYLQYAKKIVKDGITYFTHSDGILWERHRSNGYDCDQGGDHVFFKAAYLRNLREVNEVVKDNSITAFIAKTARHAWEKSRGEFDATSLCWEKGFDKHYDSGRQTSTLDLMTAAIPKKYENFVFRKAAKSSRESCNNEEGPVNVLDGDSSTKWCTKAGAGADLDINLGAVKKIHRLRIAHAGSAAMLGDVKENNTKDFEILVSNSADGPWTSVATVTGNTGSGSSLLINRKTQFLRIHISNPGADGVARIFEVIAE